MKFALCIVAVAIMATVEAKPSPFSDNSYFTADATLDSVQGAIIDIVEAATDLDTMQGMLEGVVSESTALFEVETAVEYAVDADAYENAW